MMNKVGAFCVGLCIYYASMTAMDEQQRIPVTDLNDALSFKLLKAIIEDDSGKVGQLLDLIPGDQSYFLNQYPVNAQAKELWDSKMLDYRGATWSKARRVVVSSQVNDDNAVSGDLEKDIASQWEQEKEANPTISYLYNGLLTEVKSVMRGDLTVYEKNSKAPLITLKKRLLLGLMFVWLACITEHSLILAKQIKGSLGAFDNLDNEKNLVYISVNLLQDMMLLGYVAKQGKDMFVQRNIRCDSADYRRRDIRVLLENAGMNDGVSDIV